MVSGLNISRRLRRWKIIRKGESLFWKKISSLNLWLFHRLENNTEEQNEKSPTASSSSNHGTLVRKLEEFEEELKEMIANKDKPRNNVNKGMNVHNIIKAGTNNNLKKPLTRRWCWGKIALWMTCLSMHWVYLCTAHILEEFFSCIFSYLWLW